MLTLLATSSKVVALPDDNIHLFNFPGSALSEVVIGARANDDLSERISRQISSDPALAHVVLRRAFLPQDNSAIQLETLIR